MARKTEEDFPDIAWKPHLVKADRFLGTFDQEWWSVATRRLKHELDDGFLVPLLPLLEHPLPRDSVGIPLTTQVRTRFHPAGHLGNFLP